MWLLGTLFTVPSDALTQIGNVSAPVFSDMFPLVAVVGGIFLAIGVALVLIRTLMGRH